MDCKGLRPACVMTHRSRRMKALRGKQIRVTFCRFLMKLAGVDASSSSV